MSSVRPIPGFPGYAAHEDGYILSFWRVEPVRAAKKGSRSVIGEVCVPLRSFDRKLIGGKASGYLSVCVKHADGRRRNRYVHELILYAFKGPRPSSAHEALHGERGSLDNRPDNLRWGTTQENADDRERQGHVHRGDAWYRARGLPPPWLVQQVECAPTPETESSGAFDDLLGHPS